MDIAIQNEVFKQDERVRILNTNFEGSVFTDKDQREDSMVIVMFDNEASHATMPKKMLERLEQIGTQHQLEHPTNKNRKLLKAADKVTYISNGKQKQAIVIDDDSHWPFHNILDHKIIIRVERCSEYQDVTA